MAFRDDRDALRDKADSLQADLQRAEQELGEHRHRAERIRQLEAKLGDARAAISRIEQELAREQGRPPQRPAPVGLIVAAGALVALAVMGGVFALVVLRTTPSPPPIAAPMPPPEPVAPPTVEPVPLPPPVTATAEALPRAAKRTWAGTVKRSTGMSLPHTRCTVAATLHTPKAVSDVTIECGGKSLYRSSDQLEGMSSTSWGFDEVPAQGTGAKPGTARNRLKYQDQGPRTGPRTQASIDSPAKVAVAWAEGATAFRVEIALDELSAPGEPLDQENIFDQRR